MALFGGLDLGKLKESVESGAKAAAEGLATINVDEVVQGAKGAAAASVTMVGDTIGGVAKGAVESLVKSPTEEGNQEPSARDFISLLWYLASVDGSVTEEEIKTIGEVARSIDESYADYEARLRRTCRTKLRESTEEFGAPNAAKIEAQKVIESLNLSSEDAKLLCWNLLVVANADGTSDDEIDFILFVSKKANVDTAVFEELRNHSEALVEIGKSREQLRKSSRSYGEIEPIVNEYAQREQTIFKAAQALISDR